MGTPKRERQKAGRQSRRQVAVAQAKRARTRRALIGYSFFALLILGIILAFGVFRGGGDDTPAVPPTTTADPSVTTAPPVPLYGTTPCPPVDGAAEPIRQFSSPFERCLDPELGYAAVITTNLGELQVQLDAERAPATVNNFVALARNRFYDGLDCHRIIPDFVAQCGDPRGDGTGGPGYRFADELPEPGEYRIGSLAMANSGPNTNGSQFFVITGQRGMGLPPNFSLFGHVVDSDEVLAALDAVGNPDPDANGIPPLEPVTIESVRILES